MGWDRGRYYSRSRKVNGRVVREYVGGGRLGQIAARLDAIGREVRQAARARQEAMRSEVEALDAALDDLNAVADLLGGAALLAAGYRQHKRGEWRKSRVRADQGG
jgi:hypothetical protein